MKNKIKILSLLLIFPACATQVTPPTPTPTATALISPTSSPTAIPSVTPTVSDTPLPTHTVMPTPITSLGNEFLVSISGEQFSIIKGDNDSFIIFWRNGMDEFFSRKYNYKGEALTDEIKISSEIKTMPQVASDINGNYIMAWTKYNNPFDKGNEIYIRRFDKAGNTIGTDKKVNTGTDKRLDSLNLSMNHSGEFVLSWAEYTIKPDPTPNQSFSGYEKVELMIQKFNSIAEPQNPLNVINLNSKFRLHYGKLGIDTTGNYVVAWNDNRKLSLRKYDSTGNIVTSLPDFINNEGTGLEGVETSLHNMAMNDKGDFVLSWLSRSADSNNGATIQLFKVFSANLVPLSSEIKKPSDLSITYSNFPVSLAIDENDNFYSGFFANNITDTEFNENIYIFKHTEKNQQDTFIKANNYIKNIGYSGNTALIVDNKQNLIISWQGNQGIYFKKLEY